MGPDEAPTQGIGPGRVLVVDDEPRILSFVARGLRRVGLLVDVAARGEEALRLALANRYDVVILDLLLPDLPGTEVLARLMQERPDQCVIVMSALGDTASKVACLDLGAEDYVSKPCSLEELLARIRARLRRSSEPGPSRYQIRQLKCNERIER